MTWKLTLSGESPVNIIIDHLQLDRRAWLQWQFTLHSASVRAISARFVFMGTNVNFTSVCCPEMIHFRSIRKKKKNPQFWNSKPRWTLQPCSGLKQVCTCFVLTDSNFESHDNSFRIRLAVYWIQINTKITRRSFFPIVCFAYQMTYIYLKWERRYRCKTVVIRSKSSSLAKLKIVDRILVSTSIVSRSLRLSQNI